MLIENNIRKFKLKFIKRKTQVLLCLKKSFKFTKDEDIS